VLQGTQQANAFLRSVSQELPAYRFCCVEYETVDRRTVALALALYAEAAQGYDELRLRDGRPQRREFSLLPAKHTAEWRPTPNTVLLVSGGARGIGALSAAALARHYKVCLALVGRGAPADGEISRNLELMCAEGIVARYFQVDLADAVQVRQVVAQIEACLGPVRGILHAAGVNQPCGIRELDSERLAMTLAAKVDALKGLLGCVPAGQLEWLVGYGSIIGELGLAGEAHYALANEWLAELLQQYASASPTCRVVCLGWSAWRQAGMAVKLDGVLDSLQGAGMRPLENDEAVTALIEMLSRGGASRLVVAGRYGRSIDPVNDLRKLQQYRYLDRPLIYYPGVELVAEAEVSSDTDRYLRDHAPSGVPVFPLVCAVEAMLSAACCLSPEPIPLGLRELQVAEGIVCAPGQTLVLRTSALVLPDGGIRAEVRASQTGYEVVHFSATVCRAMPTGELSSRRADDGCALAASQLVYRGTCFHGPRFQRIIAIEQSNAWECAARIGGEHCGDWYAPLLPRGFTGGDPALRDAAIHAIQLCVPHQLVLPIAVEEVSLGKLASGTTYTMHARQRSAERGRYAFDMEIAGPTGEIVERWVGLQLQRVPPPLAAEPRPMDPMLLEPLVGRLILEEWRLPAATFAVGVALEPIRSRGSTQALARAQRTWSGAGRDNVTTSHADDITLVLASAGHPLAVDLQFMPNYDPEEWCLMLGPERTAFAFGLLREFQLSKETAFLYTWTLSECLVKLGITGWPLGQARKVRLDTAFCGVVVKLHCEQLQCMVLMVEFFDRPAMAALALALTDPAVAETGGEQLYVEEGAK
jgi:enediyne polyketide synthase